MLPRGTMAGVIALRILGGLLVIVGLVLAYEPTLVHDPGGDPDLFEAIERHVRWGLLAGLGALLAVRTKLRPWRVTLAHVVLWASAGYLAARLIGIAIEGASSGKQWMWVGVEAVICAVLGAYAWRKREDEPEVPS